MITLSPTAIRQLNISCSSNQRYVRLALRSGGCAGYSYDWSYDDIQEGDTLIEVGNYGLIVDPLSQSLLGNTSINFLQELFGSSWEIKSENTSSSCGCGSSIFIQQDGTSKFINSQQGVEGGCNG